MNINLHIERLILDGLPLEHRDGALVKAAAEAELGRLLAADGLTGGLNSGGAVASVSAPGIQLANNSSPRKLGQQIARALHRGISK